MSGMNRRSFLGTSLKAGALFIGGCATAFHNRDNTNRVDRKTIDAICENSQVPTTNPAMVKDEHALIGAEAERVQETYGDHMPKQALTMYFAEQGQKTPIKSRHYDATANVNGCLDEIAGVENWMPSKSKTRGLIYGPPDRTEIVSSSGADNQLSNQCGLLGMQNYYTKGDGFFFVEVEEVTGIKKNFRENKHYNVKITFGKKAYSAAKKRADYVGVIKAAERSALGFAVAGVVGAIGTAAHTAIDATWGYFEGRQVPKGNLVTDDRRNIATVDDKTADTYHAFVAADELSSKGMIAYKHSEGTALIYTGNATNVQTKDNAIMFETDQTGINHLYGLLYEGAVTATRYTAGKVDTDTKFIIEKCDPHGGNRLQGIGGTGGAAGGSNSGGTGGG